MTTKVFKTLVLTIMLISFSCVALASGKGQNDKAAFELKKFDVRLAWGGAPLIYPIYLPFSKSEVAPTIGEELGWIYKDYSGPLYSIGTITAEFSINFKKWFSLVFELGYQGLYSDLFSPDGVKIKREHGFILTFMPKARFTYLNRPMVSLYSAIAIGITGGKNGNNSGVLPTFHTTLFGVTFGKKVFGLCEIGGGLDFIGGKIGIGYRF